MISTDILIALGLSPREGAVYLATLELGMAPASVIARKTGLKRTSVHEILRKLEMRGLAEYFVRKQTRYFSVLSPKLFCEKYEKVIGDFRSALPELMALENRIVRKPKVSFYEGKEALKRLYLDPLTSAREILNYFHPEKLFEYFGEEWVREKAIGERIRRRIPVRVIMPASPLAEDFRKRGGEELRNARIIQDPNLLLPNEIYLYENKFSIFSFDDDLALLIESEDVVRTQRTIFELAWQSGGLK